MSGVAEDLVRRYLQLVTEGRWEMLPGLYADDAVVCHPLDPGQAVLRGRAAIAGHFAQLAGWQLRLRPERLRLHQTQVDSSGCLTVISEFDYLVTGADASDGPPRRRRNVFVWQVRAGMIVAARDYATVVADQPVTGAEG